MTSVLGDLEYLELQNLNIEDIRSMKQASFVGLVKEKVRDKAFESLSKIKNSHSKVKNIEHTVLKIQKYLQPNKVRITKEECKLIFQLRCKVTNVKANMKNRYEELVCGACKLAEETQEHILECEKLNEKEDNKMYNYEKINNGTVTDKLDIAKKFYENFKRLEEFK